MKSGIQIRIKTSWIRHTVCNNRDPIAQIFQPGWTRQVGPDRLDQTGWTRQVGPDRLDQTGWTRQAGPDRLDQTGWTRQAPELLEHSNYAPPAKSLQELHTVIYIKKTDAEKLMTWPWLKQHFFTC